MNIDYPVHPLFDQLVALGTKYFRSNNYELLEVSQRICSYANKDGLVITIQHQGYDMPTIMIGNRSNQFISQIWGPLEYYFNRNVPLYLRHQKLESFYDFKFEEEFLVQYENQLLELINNPENFYHWEKDNDVELIFEKINS